MISKTSKSVNYMEKAAYREKKEKQSIHFRYVKPSDIVRYDYCFGRLKFFFSLDI
jgi:hypothetical protein